MTHWTFLCIAGLLEIIVALAMKSSEGFTRLMPMLRPRIS
ncbi:SMR family transporter [Pseudoduganella sp. UC29_106]